MKVHIKKTLTNIGWTDGEGKLIKFFSLKKHTLNNNNNSSIYYSDEMWGLHYLVQSIMFNVRAVTMITW